MANMAHPIVCGIYKIVCSVNKKIYIGSSKRIYHRFSRHLGLLRQNKHTNRHLQFAFNLYGEPAFSIELIEKTCPEELLDRESFWIKKLRSTDDKIGFNLSSKTYGGKIYDVHPMQGKKLTKQHLDKAIANNRNRGKISMRDAIQIRELYDTGNFLQKDLAFVFELNTSSISDIVNYKKWKYGKL